MAIKKNANNRTTKKPDQKASPKKDARKSTVKKGLGAAPKKKDSAKKESKRAGGKKGARERSYLSDEIDPDDLSRDDMGSFDDDQPSPQDEDAEASD